MLNFKTIWANLWISNNTVCVLFFFFPLRFGQLTTHPWWSAQTGFCHVDIQGQYPLKKGKIFCGRIFPKVECKVKLQNGTGLVFEPLLFYRSIVLYSTVRLLPMLQQICSGMKLYGLLSLVQKEKDICRQLFVLGSFSKVSNTYCSRILHWILSKNSTLSNCVRSFWWNEGGCWFLGEVTITCLQWEGYNEASERVQSSQFSAGLHTGHGGRR